MDSALCKESAMFQIGVMKYWAGKKQGGLVYMFFSLFLWYMGELPLLPVVYVALAAVN